MARLSEVLTDLSVDPTARARGAVAAASVLGLAAGSIPSLEGADTTQMVVAALRRLDHAKAAPPNRRFLARAIMAASAETGISASYMWRTAVRESALNPYAVSPRSSARGLYQFIEPTWLAIFAQHGRRSGHEVLASKVRLRDDGGAEVDDPGARRRILALRYNAFVSARMAAWLAVGNRAELGRRLGRPTSDDELYLAHLFGVEGAVRLLTAGISYDAPAADRLLPNAAAANPTLFYRSGRALSARALLEGIANG